MRQQLGLLVVAFLARSVAAAQSTTADGIAALARGDAAEALRILRPVADAASEPDPLAQFFLAALYDTGAGVAIDPIRACGLYLKSATTTNPLASQAIALADAIRQADPRMRALCSTASDGTWREPPPARFVLGPDHWVTTDASGFTVGYRGTRRTVPTNWGGLEWVFLPTRYTRLDVTRPVGMARHFIEFFCWIPDDVQTPTMWGLIWSVYEVVESHAQVVPQSVAVANVSASRPPTSYPVEAIARLQVNADGEVERVVSGPNGRTSVVPYQGRQ